MREEVNIHELTGKIFHVIEGMEEGSEKIRFFTGAQEGFEMYHEQDCCEDVHLEDVCGDVGDLLNVPILSAYQEDSDGVGSPVEDGDGDSFTWTFYRIATIKGTVTLRWYGTSNGYYSEDVCIVRIGENDQPVCVSPLTKPL